MMVVYCQEKNSRVMLDLGSVSTITGDGGLIDVTYRCICGRPGRLSTGRDRTPVGTSGHAA